MTMNTGNRDEGYPLIDDNVTTDNRAQEDLLTGRVRIKLFSTMLKAQERYPALRLGQLLVSSITKRTGSNNITDALFTITDAELTEVIGDF